MSISRKMGGVLVEPPCLGSWWPYSWTGFFDRAAQSGACGAVKASQIASLAIVLCFLGAFYRGLGSYRGCSIAGALLDQPQFIGHWRRFAAKTRLARGRIFALAGPPI